LDGDRIVSTVEFSARRRPYRSLRHGLAGLTQSKPRLMVARCPL